MVHRLAALHDAHDGGLRLVMPVGGDALVRFLVLLRRFLELDLVDLDAVLGVGKGEVDGEGVGSVDVAALGVLGEDAVSGAGERLEGAVEFGGGLDGLVHSQRLASGAGVE